MPLKAPAKKISNEIIAGYMTAELGSLTQRALQHENALANKINFFLVAVTTVGGGLTLASGNPFLQKDILPLSIALALIFHVMGWITLSQGLDLRAGSTIFYRRMGRIRQWFLDHEASLAPYLPFEPGDNRPLFYVAYAPIRSIESILLLVNSLTAGAVASLVWLFAYFQVLQPKTSQTSSLLITLIVGALVAVLIWSLQLRYIRRFMFSREKWETDHGRVHFKFD